VGVLSRMTVGVLSRMTVGVLSRMTVGVISRMTVGVISRMTVGVLSGMTVTLNSYKRRNGEKRHRMTKKINEGCPQYIRKRHTFKMTNKGIFKDL